jgi:dipeptidyl aminopeptidase/acylaminoacyl peptidase
LREVVPGYLHLPLPAVFAQRAVDRAGERGGFDPDEASPLAAIGTTKAAVLLVHGKKDWKIPVSHSERLFARARGRAELAVLPNGAHDDLVTSRGAEVAERAVAWFEGRM